MQQVYGMLHQSTCVAVKLLLNMY